jgi:hypothetical protein
VEVALEDEVLTAGLTALATVGCWVLACKAETCCWRFLRMFNISLPSFAPTVELANPVASTPVSVGTGDSASG